MRTAAWATEEMRGEHLLNFKFHIPSSLIKRCKDNKIIRAEPGYVLTRCLAPLHLMESSTQCEARSSLNNPEVVWLLHKRKL